MGICVITRRRTAFFVSLRSFHCGGCPRQATPPQFNLAYVFVGLLSMVSLPHDVQALFAANLFNNMAFDCGGFVVWRWPDE